MRPPVTTYQLMNPATGAVVGEVPNGGAEDVDRAVRAAVRAQRAWGHLAAKEQAEIPRGHGRWRRRSRPVTLWC
jgi:acyl-CoA reductase-like NAD-dependent aldehyde dehydrogenase